MNWLLLVNSYLQGRRNLGHSLKIDDRILQGFVDFADTRKAHLPLELPLVLEWADLAPSGSEIAISRRVAIEK